MSPLYEKSSTHTTSIGRVCVTETKRNIYVNGIRARTVSVEGIDYKIAVLSNKKGEKLTFAWIRRDFYLHTEGRNAKEAIFYLKSRGKIISLDISFKDIQQVKRYCLPGTRQWLRKKGWNWLADQLKGFYRWSDLPFDTLMQKHSFASFDIFNNRL